MEQWLTFHSGTVHRHPLWKRAFDIVGSLFILFVCLPLFLVIPIIIIIFSKRPVFFTQTRTGMHNKKFRIVKFRTMKVSTHNKKGLTYNWEEGVPDHFQFKTGSDESVTTIGKFLRKYSLDELPQLLNVLVGHMSLVGPRPEIPAITELYSHEQVQRLLVKPGITGYAQVNGRSDINHGKKIEYDLYYVQNRSLRLDVKIIVATIVAVIKAKGAY
ncbi:sugar transferase [Sporosarcina sp. YIM B06819]|uniref:sugar transferase n=1 Tax=Sporosarcina sp. YIM B06819 TaxID=3081769 RepID=UPI00298C53F4|nr:sugar transferase [Sporosarcina sp. YIM B06819]